MDDDWYAELSTDNTDTKILGDDDFDSDFDDIDDDDTPSTKPTTQLSANEMKDEDDAMSDLDDLDALLNDDVLND